MRKKRNSVIAEVKLKIVKEALAGINIATLARMYDCSPESIRKWIREYQDEVNMEDIPKPDDHLVELRRLQEVENKYEHAVKVLGEKELEIEILRSLLKKNNPAYPKSWK